MKQKNTALFDIIFYVVFPFVVWKFSKGIIGNYYAMLLSSVPGIIYTLYRFQKDRQFNVTGLFIIGTLIIGTIVDLVSGSAKAMLWNDAYYHIVLGIAVMGTVLIKKPLTLFFAVDIAAIQGSERAESYQLYKQAPLFRYFQYFTLFYGGQYIAVSFLKMYLISVFGVDGYGQMKVLMTAVNWVIAFGIGVGFVLISQKIQKQQEAAGSNILQE
ncbi:VC0807 family protein [Microbacteriaceae bacterium 4G12]